jgi:peptidoglycan/LPS O-acetylase OafA/YrhL
LQQPNLKIIGASKALPSTYRPEIDGLRAISILVVIFFHAFPDSVPGGFIGVDVFFAISGYLISGIIFRELKKQSFSFSQFYSGRVKRIFPALLVVLVATYGLGWIILLPDEFRQLGKQITSSMGFYQNFSLWKQADYFDTKSTLKPLLHLWSLSIEEQFYVTYPFLIWAAWRSGLNLLTVIGVLAAISLGYDLDGIASHPVRTFYLPHARAWELLAGCLLARLQSLDGDLTGARPTAARVRRILFGRLLFERPPPTERQGPLLAGLSELLGLALIAAATFSFREHTPYPGWRAALPVAGALLVTAAGSQTWCNRKLLGSAPMALLGKVSYPLYLWHWPLLSYLHILQGETIPVWLRLAALALSFVLAWATYRLVERPIRFGPIVRGKVPALCGIAIVVAAGGIWTNAEKGLPGRPVVALNPALSTGTLYGELGYVVPGCGLEAREDTPRFYWCVSDNRGPARFALLGDSKAGALYKGLFDQSNAGARWFFIGDPRLAPLISDAEIYRSFQPNVRAAVEALSHNKGVDLVVLTMATRAVFRLRFDFSIEDLPASPNLDAAFAGLDNTVATLVGSGKKVVITVDNPTLVDPKYCLSRVTSIEAINDIIDLGAQRAGCSIAYGRQIELSQKYRTLLRRIAEKYPDNVRIFDPTDLLCDLKTGQCSTFRDGKMLYSYSDHISDFAAREIARRLIPFAEDFAGR